MTLDKLTKMRGKLIPDDNVGVIEPALLYLDLSKENNIILTDQKKTENSVQNSSRNSEK